MNSRRATVAGLLAALLAVSSAAAQVEADTHVVQSGETLWSIATNRLGDGKRWSEIAALNNIPSPYQIEVGRVLALPEPRPSRSASGSPPAAPSPRESGFALDSGPEAQPEHTAEPPRSANVDSVMAAPAAPAAAERSALPSEAPPPESVIPRPPGSSLPGARMLTLGDAVKEALIQSPEIAAAKAALERTQAERGVAFSGALPQVSATGDVRRSETFKATSTLGLDEVTAGGGVSISQALLSFGRLSSALKAASAQEAAAAASLVATRNGVRLRVETAFFAFLLAKERERVARESLDAARELERRARVRERAGEGTVFDIVRAEAERSAREARLAGAISAASGAREELAVSMGLDPSAAIDASGELFDSLRPIDPDRALEIGLRERPDLAAMDWSVRSGEALIELERAQGRPTVGAFASWNYTFHDYITTSPFFKGQDASSGFVGVGVTVPIFDGFRVRERVKAQEAATAELKARRDRLHLDARREIRGIYLDLSAAEQALESRRAGVRAAREALRIAEVSFSAGRATSLDVIQASLSLTEAMIAEAEAAYAYRTGISRLVFATGSDETIERR